MIDPSAVVGWLFVALALHRLARRVRRLLNQRRGRNGGKYR